MSTARYEIRVKGHLDRARWSRWFDGMEVTLEPDGTTVLAGPVVDQSALHGLLGKVRGRVVVPRQRSTGLVDPGAPARHAPSRRAR